MYRDYSTLAIPPVDQAEDRKASSKTQNFPSKLFRLLAFVDIQKAKGEDLSPICTFDPNGRSFQIIQKKKFEEVLLTKFFNTKKYESFRKQLNVWGFKRVNNKSWYHEMFLRSKPELCQFMKRRVKSQEQDCLPPFCFDIEEPSFDELPWLPPTLGTGAAASVSESSPRKKEYQPRLIYSRADSDNTMNTTSETASSMHTSYNSLPPMPVSNTTTAMEDQKRSLTDMLLHEQETSYKRSKISDVLHMSLPHDMKFPSASFYQDKPHIVSDHSRRDSVEHMRADEANDLDTLFRRHEYEEKPLPVPSNVTMPVSTSSKPNLDRILTDFSSMEQTSYVPRRSSMEQTSYVPRRSSSKIIDSSKLLASLGLRIDTHDSFYHSRRDSFNTALKNLDAFCDTDDLPEDLTDFCNVFEEKDVEVKDQALKLAHNDNDSAIVSDWHQKLMRRSSFLSNGGSIA